MGAGKSKDVTSKDIANDGKVRSALISLKSALEDGVLSKQECEELFKRYDKDNSGTIERAEIQQMVGDIMVAKGQDKKEVDEMLELGGFQSFEQQLFKYFDKGDKDGKIDQEEFVARFPSYVSTLIKKEVTTEAAILTLSSALADGSLDEKTCKQLFKRYDKDGSGSIERPEIKDIIGDLLKAKGQDPKEVDELLGMGGFVHYEQQLFKIFDTGDKDGKIDEAEFVAKFPGYVAAIVKKDGGANAEKKQEERKD